MTDKKTPAGKKIRCLCQVCRPSCGMIATVEGNRIIKVEGDPDDPRSRGGLCVMGRHAHLLAQAKDRLTVPMRRSGDGFKNTEWNRVLDEITERLTTIRRESGPASVVLYGGYGMKTIGQALMRRFAIAFGTPYSGGGGSLCVSSKIMGYMHTFGPPRVPCSNFRNARCILLLGANPSVSTMNRYLSVADDIEHARLNGAKLIVADPRRCEAAEHADIYLQIRPGTDLALVLAMLNVVIAEGLYDRDFVERYTTGFSQLAERVEEYTPRWAAGVTELEEGEIEQAARLIATTRPASLDRREGVQHHVNGYQTIRAIACLIAITGNVDCEGGLVFNPGYPLANLSPKEMVTDRPAWAERFPLALDAVSTLPEEILAGNVRAMLVVGGNPAITLPNSSRVSKALDALDLLVVHDLFLTETAQHAHYVLPASSFLEKLEISSRGVELSRFITDSPPVIPPRGESLPEWKLFCELGKRMGFEGFDFSDSEEIVERLLAPYDFPRDNLREASYEKISPGWVRERGFQTPSGKIELYCEILQKHGYDPLPGYVEPSESPVSQPEQAGDYPLILTTGARLPWFIHSQLHNLPAMAKNAPLPLLEIHEKTARKLGITDGDSVVVETPRGSMEAVARYADIFGGAVSIMHGFPGTGNANLLTDDGQLDTVSAMPAFRSLLCRVRQA